MGMGTVEHLINRYETSIPLYAQIAESLLDRIESGELRPGDRLPPERNLSRVLGVNRMTVRRALQVLESQGLLLRRQGAGTYVAEPKIERQAAQLVPFTQGMRCRGHTPGARVILLERHPAEVSVASELGLSVSAPVYHIHRLRLINQEPLLLERIVMPAHRFPELERYDLSNRSLYEIMETEYGVSVVRARQSLEPVIATEYEAKLLQVQQGAPLMLERRLAFDQSDQPVEHAKDLYRGDRFRFITEIAPIEL
ncbi:MAG: GntR family transcriptional regulator [Chloroflexi bacterium]|nr:GntR family transcriptional regulator [Chloroflexota bacterium]